MYRYLLTMLVIGGLSGPLVAAQLPAFTLQLHDGQLTPQAIQVPANTRFKLVLRNTGKTPAEFESRRLRQEKVLGPGVTSFVVIHPLKPGEYGCFDEFHLPDAKGSILAQ
jgi:hypothetical protein